MAVDPITPLENVDVDDADLIKVKPDLTAKYLFPSQTDFSEQILKAKRRLHREIQDRDGLNDTQMELVKDTQLDTLKDKIVLLSISEIFLINGLVDMSDAYERQAAKAPTKYLYDTNEDDIQDANEDRNSRSFLLGR